MDEPPPIATSFTPSDGTGSLSDPASLTEQSQVKQALDLLQNVFSLAKHSPLGIPSPTAAHTRGRTGAPPSPSTAAATTAPLPDDHESSAHPPPTYSPGVGMRKRGQPSGELSAAAVAASNAEPAADRASSSSIGSAATKMQKEKLHAHFDANLEAQPEGSEEGAEEEWIMARKTPEAMAAGQTGLLAFFVLLLLPCSLTISVCVCVSVYRMSHAPGLRRNS